MVYGCCRRVDRSMQAETKRYKMDGSFWVAWVNLEFCFWYEAEITIVFRGGGDAAAMAHMLLNRSGFVTWLCFIAKGGRNGYFQTSVSAGRGAGSSRYGPGGQRGGQCRCP